MECGQIRTRGADLKSYLSGIMDGILIKKYLEPFWKRDVNEKFVGSLITTTSFILETTHHKNNKIVHFNIEASFALYSRNYRNACKFCSPKKCTLQTTKLMYRNIN